MQNTTGNLSLFYYVGLLCLARLCGCKTRLMSAGIGPINGKIAERTVIFALRRCDRIEVRDLQSERFLLEKGFERAVVRLVCDPATQLDFPPASRLIFLRRELGLKPDQKYFCVVVRRDPSPGGACLGKISAALRLFLRAENLTPVFVIFDAKHDVDVTERICRSVGGLILRPCEARDAMSVIAGGRFLVSMRLHAMVFAAMGGVGALAISPFDQEPKLASFCRERHLVHLAPSEVTVAGMLEELAKLSKE